MVKSRLSWVGLLTSKTALLVYGVVLGILIFAVFQEKNSRYVSEFKKTSAVKSEEYKPTPKATELLNLMLSMEPGVKKYEWFSKLDEIILLKFIDAEGALFTVKIKKGDVSINYGWDTSEKPTLVLENVRVAHINRLKQIVSSGVLKESDMFEIASVFLVPGLQALYNSDVLFYNGDKRLLQLDNFIQVELTNKYGVKDLEGNLLIARATVVNVDGQWLVYSGWQGTPDVRYTVDVNQMIKYYYLINYKFRGLKVDDLLKRKELFDEYMQLRAETLTFSAH